MKDLFHLFQRSPQVTPSVSAEEIGRRLEEYEALEASTTGLLSGVDAGLAYSLDESRQMRVELRAWAKLLRAEVEFMRDTTKVTETQWARLDEIAATFDDLIDTLNWGLEDNEALPDETVLGRLLEAEQPKREMVDRLNEAARRGRIEPEDDEAAVRAAFREAKLNEGRALTPEELRRLSETGEWPDWCGEDTGDAS